MYTGKFKELVNIAYTESEALYENHINNSPNPYYIGFGNPNAKVLIVGQEKAIDLKNIDQIKFESIENPNQWKKLVDNNISDIKFKFSREYFFKSPLHPYDGKPKKGNTWNYYQRILEFIYPDLKNGNINNSFLLESFITEINHEVSPKRLGNQRNPLRTKFMNCDFYMQFPITIIAIGNYLSKSEVEDRFNVKYFSDESEPNKKLVVYKNDAQNRILIHTRQFSQFFFDDMQLNLYLNKIADLVQNYRH